jgi:hypothetical protein
VRCAGILAFSYLYSLKNPELFLYLPKTLEIGNLFQNFVFSGKTCAFAHPVINLAIDLASIASSHLISRARYPAKINVRADHSVFYRQPEISRIERLLISRGAP